jgi:hypothetical protein
MIDEIQELKHLRADVPDADTAAMLRARSRLVLHASATKSTASFASRRRFLLAGAVAVGLVAAGVIVALPGAGSASAAEVLNKAADAAAAKPVIPARPGQFSYVETSETTPGLPEFHEQIWFPVDGKGTGVRRVGHGDQRSDFPARCGGIQFKFPGSGSIPENAEPILCDTTQSLSNPNYEYLGKLPTDQKELRRLVYEEVGKIKGSADDPDHAAYFLIMGLLKDNVVPSPQLAALFKVLAAIPGATIVADAVVGGGQHGVGVRWALGEGEWLMLVFDRDNYRLLGQQLFAYHGKLMVTTMKRSGIVDQVGQLP